MNHMKLEEYLANHSKLFNKTEFAAKIGIDVSTLVNYLAGRKKISLKVKKRIQKKTHEAVTLEDLS